MNNYLGKNFNQKEIEEQKKMTALVCVYESVGCGMHVSTNDVGFIHLEYMDNKNIKVSVLDNKLSYLIDQFVVNENSLKEENVSPYEEIVREIYYLYFDGNVGYVSENHKSVAFNIEKNKMIAGIASMYGEFSLTRELKDQYNYAIKCRKQIFA